MKKHIALILTFTMLFTIVQPFVVSAYTYDKIDFGAGTLSDPVRYKDFREYLNPKNDISCPTAAFTVTIGTQSLNSQNTTLKSDGVTASNPMYAKVGDVASIATQGADNSVASGGYSLDRYDWQVTFREEGTSSYVLKEAASTVFSNKNFTFDKPGTYNFYLNVRDSLPHVQTLGWGNWAMNGVHESIGRNPGPTGSPTDDLYGYWYYAQIQVIVSPQVSTLEEKHIDRTSGKTLYNELHKNITEDTKTTQAKTFPGYSFSASKEGYTPEELESCPESTQTSRTAHFSSTTPTAFHYYYYEPLPGLFPNFAIKHSGTDYTDKQLTVTKLPVTVNLEDLSVGENIINWTWEYKTEEMPSFEVFSAVQNPTKELDGEKTYTFRLTVKNATEKKSTEHYVTVKIGAPAGIPPIAVITGPSQRMAGESITFSGAGSVDPDGTIVSYIWNIPDANIIRNSGKTITVWYPEPGEYDLDLTVVDDSGMTGDCMTTITIIPPIPTAVIGFSGQLRENRKVTVNGGNSYSPAYYPIKKYTWTMTNGADARYIGSFGSEVSKDMIFKKAQSYNFGLRVDNTYGLSHSASNTAIIAPDLEPIAEIDVVSKVVRNPDDDNNATIMVNNLSRSNDGDVIGKTVFFKAYDSNNNGLAADETWYYSTDGSSWLPTGLTYSQLKNYDLHSLSCGNSGSIAIKTKDVGKVFIIAKAMEDIPDEDTIPELLSPEDYKTSLSALKTVEVINTAPIVSFEIKKKKPLDLVIVTDYSSTKLSQLQSQITAMETNLRALNIDTKVSVITNKVPIASQTANKYNYYRNLNLYARVDYGEGSDIWMHPWPYYTCSQSRWESIDCYEAPAADIPLRRHYSWGGFAYYYNSPSGNSRSVVYRGYDTSGGSTEVEFTTYYRDPWAGYEYNWKTYSILGIGVDPEYIKGSYLSTDTFTVYNMDVEGIRNIPLREKSDRYLMFLSDGKGKDYSRSYGESFALGNLTQSLKDYTIANKMKVYSVLDTKTLYTTLLNEMIVDVQAAGDIIMQRTAAGDVWLKDKNGKTYKIDESVHGEVKGVFKGNLVLFNNGSAKYFDGDSLKPFPVSNIISSDVYGTGQYGYVAVATSNAVYLVNLPGLSIRKSFGGYSNITSIRWANSIERLYVFTAGQGYKLVDTDNNWEIDTNQYLFYGSSIKEATDLQYQYTNFPHFGLATNGALYKCNWDKSEGAVAYNVKDIELHLSNLASDDGRGLYLSYFLAVLTNDGNLLVDYPVITGGRWVGPKGEKEWVNTYGNTVGLKPISLPGVTFKSIATIGTITFALGNDNNLYQIVWSNGLSGLTVRNSYIASIENPNSNYIICTQTDGTPIIKDKNSSRNYYNVKKVAAAEFSPIILYNDGKTNIDVLPKNITLYNPSTAYMPPYNFVSGSLDNKVFGVGQYAQALDDISNTYMADPSYSTNRILLNDEVEVKTYYNDYENDPKYKEFWTYNHDQHYYDIPLGIASFNGKTLETPITKFDKTGKYAISLKIKDNPKDDDAFNNYRLSNVGLVSLNLYVHRKPVALSRVSITPNGSLWHVQAFDAGSFDPDHVSRADKGIVASEWSWKEQYELLWHNGRMNKTDCEGSKIYYIRYRVKDLEGVWSDYNTIDLDNDNLPVALFTIEKNPLPINEYAKIKDQSYTQSFSTITKWHWIVKKLNDDGSIPSGNIQNYIYPDSNKGAGGYDNNVKTDFSDTGTGTYRIYLRVKDSNGLWSDGGTDGSFNLDNFYSQDITVQESFKMSSFRVVLIRDFHLKPYYNVNGKYPDKPFHVNSMAIDSENFKVGGISIVPGFSSLTKGYRFEFEIDTVNFNEAKDTIVITPTFYTYIPGVPGTRGPEADLYWEDSDKDIYKAGEGGHSRWASITLDSNNRTLTGENEATWRGEYFIPATSWLTPLGTSEANAKSSRISADIIVNFGVKGYSAGELKYDYNLQQWPIERTSEKHPYEIGDVIRYDHTKNCFDDQDIIINRP